MSHKAEHTTKAERILSALVEAAETGAPCPGNPELARLVGCTRKWAGEIVTSFRDEGKITVEVRGTKRRVTIIETGKSTAPLVPAVRSRCRPRPPVSVGAMIELASRIFGTPADEIRSGSRKRRAVRPRQAVCVVALRHGWGPSHIGRAFGMGNSCVYHARDNERVFAVYEPDFAQGVTALERAVVEQASAPSIIRPQLRTAARYRVSGLPLSMAEAA